MIREIRRDLLLGDPVPVVAARYGKRKADIEDIDRAITTDAVNRGKALAAKRAFRQQPEPKPIRVSPFAPDESVELYPWRRTHRRQRHFLDSAGMRDAMAAAGRAVDPQPDTAPGSCAAKDERVLREEGTPARGAERVPASAEVRA